MSWTQHSVQGRVPNTSCPTKQTASEGDCHVGGGACWAKAAGWAGGVTEGGRNRPSKDLGMAGLKREVSSAFSDGRSEARV